MKKLLPLVMIALVAVIGCQGGSDVPEPTPEGEDGISHGSISDSERAAIVEELTQAQYDYAKAWCNEDMDFVSNCWSHDADVTVVPPATRERIVGWDNVKAWYQASFDSMSDIDFKISDVMIKVSDCGCAAVINYYVENDFVDADGNAQKFTPRVTVVKALQDGEWKQIHGAASFSIAEIQQ